MVDLVEVLKKLIEQEEKQEKAKQTPASTPRRYESVDVDGTYHGYDPTHPPQVRDKANASRVLPRRTRTADDDEWGA